MPQVVPCEIHSNAGTILKRSPGSQASKSTFNPEMPRNKTGPPPNLYELCLDRHGLHIVFRENIPVIPQLPLRACTFLSNLSWSRSPLADGVRSSGSQSPNNQQKLFELPPGFELELIPRFCERLTHYRLMPLRTWNCLNSFSSAAAS